MSVTPMTCVETLCNRAGIQVFDGTSKCKECGGDMYPYNRAEFNSGDDMPDDNEMLRLMADNFLQKRFEYTGMNATAPVKIMPRADDTFSCPPDLTGCPVAHRAKVYIPIQLYNQWVFLAGQLDTEWIAYLTGAKVPDEPDSYEVTGMYFPKQRASAAHVEAEDGDILPGTVAAVHSHVGMKVFFSNEDVKHMNHAVELVVNRMGDLIANGRIKLECGRWHRGDAAVEFIQCDEEVQLEEQLRSLLSPDCTQFTSKKA